MILIKEKLVLYSIKNIFENVNFTFFTQEAPLNLEN